MPSHTRSAWTRLGDLLVRRRIELDSRYRNRRAFTSERAVEYRIVNDVELGRRDNYEPGTIAALEVAYALAPGSIGRALAGGELDPQPVPDPEHSLIAGLPREQRERIEPYFAEIAGLVLDAIAAHPGQPLIGEWVFGDSPDAEPDAALWDSFAARLRRIYPGEEPSWRDVAGTMAIVKSREAGRRSRPGNSGVAAVLTPARHPAKGHQRITMCRVREKVVVI